MSERHPCRWSKQHGHLGWASLPRPRSCLLMALRQLFSLLISLILSLISWRDRILWLVLLLLFFMDKLCFSRRMELPSSQLLPAVALPPMSPYCQVPCLPLLVPTAEVPCRWPCHASLTWRQLWAAYKAEVI